MEKELENPEKKKKGKQPSSLAGLAQPSQAARPRCLTGGPRLSAAVSLSPVGSLSHSLPAGANLSASVFFTRVLPLYLCLAGPDRQSSSRCPARPFPFSLRRGPALSVSPPSALAVDRRVRTRARRRISRPRRPPTCPTPFLEPRQCPAHASRLISRSFTLSRALPTPPAAAGDPRPRSRPSSSPETAPSLPELRLEVRHPSPCPISPIAPCARPISPSPMLGRGGPPCSRGVRPIQPGLVPRSRSLCHPCLC
jgi:hypothetical protein